MHTLTQPVIVGGCQLLITMSQPGCTMGEKDLGNSYTQLTQALSGIANSTDRSVFGSLPLRLRHAADQPETQQSRGSSWPAPAYPLSQPLYGP